MANYHQNGGRNVALPEENRSAWSPQEQAQSLTRRRGNDDDDDDYQSWRNRNYRDDDRHGNELDPRRWEGGRGSELGYVEPIDYRSGSYGRGRGYGSHWHSGRDEASRHSGSDAHIHLGPHRGKGPIGYRRSDERIHELVCEALADDDQLDASRIEVSVNNGDVTLAGVVDDRHAKLAADECAYSVSGVRDVKNLLCVSGDPPSAVAKPASQPTRPPGGTNERKTPPQDEKHRP